jgi:hypothetical protein
MFLWAVNLQHGCSKKRVKPYASVVIGIIVVIHNPHSCQENILPVRSFCSVDQPPFCHIGSAHSHTSIPVISTDL